MNLQAVLAREFATRVQTYTWRDAALYALALGMGSDPLDADELPCVYEGYQRNAANPQPRAVPSYAVTLGWLPFWYDDPLLAIAWERIVHGEMRFTLHRPLAASGSVRATHRIAGVQDKGAGRGALLHVDAELDDPASGAPVASLRSVVFLRGDGGCGSSGVEREALPALPADFRADVHQDYATPQSAALLYRLASHDLMPIHADPAVARRAGFDRPISHGLNNMGLACRAILKRFAPGRPELVREMGVRFVQPGLPGDTVRIEMQREDKVVRFRARALERDVLILDRGMCRLTGDVHAWVQATDRAEERKNVPMDETNPGASPMPSLTRRHSIRRAVGFMCGAALVALGAGSVATTHAQDTYPNKPIRIVVPCPAGGTTHELARAIQQPLQELLGQTVIVDNKAGAGGTLGTDSVAKAAPDGYTLVFGNSGPSATGSLLRRD